MQIEDGVDIVFIKQFHAKGIIFPVLASINGRNAPHLRFGTLMIWAKPDIGLKYPWKDPYQHTWCSVLYFISPLRTTNRAHPGWSILILTFFISDSAIEIPTNSVVKNMFMPEDTDGYHNYLDKNVMLWPDDQKKCV